VNKESFKKLIKKQLTERIEAAPKYAADDNSPEAIAHRQAVALGFGGVKDKQRKDLQDLLKKVGMTVEEFKSLSKEEQDAYLEMAKTGGQEIEPDIAKATPSTPKKRGVPREFRRRNKKIAYMQDMLYRTLANAGLMKPDEFGKKKFGRGYFRGADGLYGKGTQKAINRLRANFPDAPKRMPSFSKSIDSLIEYLKVKEGEVRSSKLAMDKAKKYSADEIGSVLKNMNLVVSPDDPKAKDLIDKLMRAQAKGTPLSLKTIKLAGDTALQSESKESKSYEEGWKDFLNESLEP